MPDHLPFWPDLFGFKTVALFDLWSITHFLSGFAMLTTLRLLAPEGMRTRQALVWCLAASSAWEIVEVYLELGLAGEAVRIWFAGLEHWANRLITDQALFCAGFLVAARLPILVLPAKILSLGWLALHVLWLPHSMYLHEVLWP